MESDKPTTMTKPKYNVLDKVWVLIYGKTKELGIYGIHYTKPNPSNNDDGDIERWNYGFITYDVSNTGLVLPNLLCPSGDLTWIREDEVFATKEELLKSL